MPDYRRFRVSGGSAFFTVNLLQRRDNALLTQRIDLLREAVLRVRRDRPFVIDAFVVLPDHLHAVWTLPLGDDDTSTRWRLIKTFFVRGLARSEWRSAVRLRRGERGIWQRRFWEHAILDDADYAAHVDYVHFNPVKHGLVASPADWQYSTFRVCVERGLYPQAWAGDDVPDLSAGEAGI